MAQSISAVSWTRVHVRQERKSKHGGGKLNKGVADDIQIAEGNRVEGEGGRREGGHATEGRGVWKLGGGAGGTGQGDGAGGRGRGTGSRHAKKRLGGGGGVRT